MRVEADIGDSGEDFVKSPRPEEEEDVRDDQSGGDGGLTIATRVLRDCVEGKSQKETTTTAPAPDPRAATSTPVHT